MELNRWDDLPFHQTIAPLGRPDNSDSHFNDGYYFAWYRDGVHAFVGLRLHPNNNVADGYAGVVFRDEQRSQRFSRALHPRFDELAVGPLSVEIAEPMVAQRLRLTASDIDLSFDVTVRASAPPFVETRTPQWRYGRLINDVLRYTQVSRASGTMTLDGTPIEIDRWHACRDHSWGIRSTMGPSVPIRGAGGARDHDRRAIRIWVPFEVDDHAGFFHLHEDPDGRMLDFEGRLDYFDGRPPVVLASARHRFAYAGADRLAGGAFTLVDHQGEERSYTFTPVCAPAHPQGFGYTRGWRDGGQPGVYRGESYTEYESFAVGDPALIAGPDHIPAERRLSGTEFACALSGPGGAQGMAHVEHMVYGPYAPTGLKGRK